MKVEKKIKWEPYFAKMYLKAARRTHLAATTRETRTTKVTASRRQSAATGIHNVRIKRTKKAAASLPNLPQSEPR